MALALSPLRLNWVTLSDQNLLGCAVAMRQHKRLAEPDSDLRRTAMDALEVLRKEVGFQDDDQAEIHIGLLRLVFGDKVGLVDIRFDCTARDTVYCVSLPASTHFSAIAEGATFSRRFEIMRLHEARIDGRGRFRLSDGNGMRALEFEPKRLPAKPSDLDWRIVHLTLELVDAKDCYRSLQEGFSSDQRDMVPNLSFLDVARLSGLALPPLQDITRHIVSRHKKVSGQKIANALRKFGIRHPQARPA
jgi:hypothetical protein